VPAEKWASTKDVEAMFADRDPDVRGRAIETLVERKREAALQAVLKALQDNSDQVRARALYGALKAGVQVSDGVLSNLAVNDPSADVRLLALQGLANGPDARVVAERAVDDPNEPVRVQAREILARLDDEAKQSEQPNQPSGDEQEPSQPPQSQ
jgi:HEAT repeat protein